MNGNTTNDFLKCQFTEKHLRYRLYISKPKVLFLKYPSSYLNSRATQWEGRARQREDGGRKNEREKEREGKRKRDRETARFIPPIGYLGQGWSRLKSGAWNSSLSPMWIIGA